MVPPRESLRVKLLLKWRSTRRMNLAHRSAILEDSNDPVIRFVNMMLIEAINSGVSDIHVEPYEKFLRVPVPIRRSIDREIQAASANRYCTCEPYKGHVSNGHY